MKNKNKINPIISQHFREMQKKAWEARQKNLLKKSKVESKNK